MRPAVRLSLILVVLLSQPVVGQDARTAFFDRILTPREGPAVTAPVSKSDRDQQKRFEAAEIYRKGLVFAQQGAWREAETAFHDAERKNDKVPEYRLAAAFAYLKTHKPQEAFKRYEGFYKQDPANARALAGMIAAREEAQLYRDAVALWMRYVRLPLPAAELEEARGLLDGARELFAARYEIAENPTGGAANLATPAQELEWGLGYAKELASSGVPLLSDRETVAYVEELCKQLVKHAKQFPTNYQLFVLDTADVNATTVPGFIFVYRGLIEAAPSEAALAGVLAHEIGHSVAHHTAKKVTKSAQDQQQLENLKKSDSKLSQFLAKLLEAGNPVGAMTFSRDAEAQADRLGVHIAFDAGYDPNGLAEMFQVFEQLSPSSRNSWDLMSRTHPFSIDRINTVREYSALLPARPLVSNSPAFVRLKDRLKALPPAPDATGLMKAPTQPPTERPPIPTTTYALAPVPFAGRMPEGWTIKKQGQAVIFSAPAGTPEAEISIWIRLTPRVSQPSWAIDDYITDVKTANAKLDAIEFGTVDQKMTADGRQIRIMPFRYNSRTTAGAATAKQGLFIFAEFPDYMAIGQYAAPQAFYERLSGPFDVIWNSLTYGAAPPPAEPPAAPPAGSATGRTTFNIESPDFSGEMPQGWVARRQDDGVVIIEGAPQTEPYEMTIRLVFSAKGQASIDAVADELAQALAKLPGADVSRSKMEKTEEGRRVRVVFAEYQGKTSTGQASPFSQIISVVEYTNHFVVLGYSGPTPLFDKYAPAYDMVGATLRERR